MANTVETLGEIGTIDKLVDGTLTSLEDDRVRRIKTYTTTGVKAKALQLTGLNALTSLVLPNCEEIYNLQSTTMPVLEVFDINNINGHESGKSYFPSTPLLTHLLIRSNQQYYVPPSLWSAPTGRLAKGLGAVYVPQSKVSTYKSNTTFRTYRIESLESYPITDWSTISGTWDDIIDSIGDGTFDGSLGDIKSLDLGTEGKVYMQLVGIEQDVLASDGTTKAKTSWTSVDVLPTSYAMFAANPTDNSWSASSLRSYLANDIMAMMPQSLQSAIKEVRKYSGGYASGATVKDQTTSDKLWVPSYYELAGNTSYETQGAIYTAYYNSNTRKAKTNRAGASFNWWTRSAAGATVSKYINTSGSNSNGSVTTAFGICLGFCI